MEGRCYNRYVLVQQASGELVFEQDAFDFHVEQAIAKGIRPTEVAATDDQNPSLIGLSR